MKKIDEMKAKLVTLKTDAQALLDAGKLDDAKAKLEEVKNMKASIEMQEILDQEEEQTLQGNHKETATKNKTKENATVIRAMIKEMSGRSLTEAENALLLPTKSSPAGTNGEGYILPQDISTIIHKKVRSSKSMRNVIGYMPTTALSGSFPVENFETAGELVDFADGTDGVDAEDIKFGNVKFALQEKAAFIKLSNTLLAMSDEKLIEYVANIFAKKAINTENKMAIAILKKDKTVKELTGWDALKSSLNKDLDPASKLDAKIVTNQTGFDYLDKQKDAQGRPLLQPNPANATEYLFKGISIEMFSDAQLPSTPATKTKGEMTPFIYGNLEEGAKFVDLDGAIKFATSEHAGFMSNTTLARLIEFVDAVQCDGSDECYVYGEIETAPKTGE